jgi:hypothetical protein
LLSADHRLAVQGFGKSLVLGMLPADKYRDILDIRIILFPVVKK